MCSILERDADTRFTMAAMVENVPKLYFFPSGPPLHSYRHTQGRGFTMAAKAWVERRKRSLATRHTL